jgi:hypothetical protein
MSKELKEKLHEAIDKVIDSYPITSEPEFIPTSLITPKDGQACWVRNNRGFEYRMTYPFDHNDYPLWYPLPKKTK